MKPALSSKLPNTGTSIFTVMSALAHEHQAINLSQGFPDFPVSAELMELVAEKMRHGHNQYAPMAGVLPLREQIAKKVNSLYGTGISADSWVTVTSGGTEALFAAIACMVRPNDEVIVFEPAYDSYIPAIVLNGGIPVPIALAPPYAIDWDVVRTKITNRTKAIIINTPHNPTGSVLSANDLRALESIAQQFNLLVISDEVYEHLIFEGEHQSVLRFPALAERSFAVFSFGKTFHATGWKIGYCIAPPMLTGEFRKTHQFLTFSTHTPTQLALAEFMANPSNYLSLPSFYAKKRDLFRSLMAQTGFEFLPCDGTYFQLCRYANISGLPDVAFAEWMTREIGVAVIPVSAFYSDGDDHKIVRFCFAKLDSTLQQAAERMQRLIK
jgi:methionine transaminase